MQSSNFLGSLFWYCPCSVTLLIRVRRCCPDNISCTIVVDTVAGRASTAGTHIIVYMHFHRYTTHASSRNMDNLSKAWPHGHNIRGPGNTSVQHKRQYTNHLSTVLVSMRDQYRSSTCKHFEDTASSPRLRHQKYCSRRKNLHSECQKNAYE